jgi:hypothetical protein
VSKLEDKIIEQRNTLKTDRLDMSFGELMNMFEDGDIIITPEYQRVFRWSTFQQSRFIESILLGFPIPPIFVAEDDDGKWELVDGLQRISTIFSFFGILTELPNKNNLKLLEGELVKKELEGVTIDDLSLKLRLTLKRSICRVEIIRWDSSEDIRYELFNRLNTGATPLSGQEIRNCIFRSNKLYPVDLNKNLKEIAKNIDYIELISPSERKKEEMFLEELVLRYFAFKYLDCEIKTTISNYLTEFMRSVSKAEIHFDLEKEKTNFLEFIDLLKCEMGQCVFRPNGNFRLHLFDSLAYAIPNSYDSIQGNEKEIIYKVKKLLNDDNYSNIGTSTFSNTRIKKRMERALEIFQGA